MFIICPKCSAKYRIPDDILLEKGQKLKCSACEHIFFKGDEAPLNLGDFTQDSPQKTPAISNEAAPFSEPMYQPKDSLTAEGEQTLPEAFQPIETKQKKQIWIIPIYIIFILGLCAAGWIYHDSLKPSLSFFSARQASHTNLTAQRRHPVLRVKTNRIKEESLKPIKPVSHIPNPPKDTQILRTTSIVETVVPQPLIQSKTSEKPTASDKLQSGNTPTNMKPVSIPEILDEPADDDTALTDFQPLVEDIKPVPVTQSINLSDLDQNNFKADSVNFKIESGENGQKQLLIEGQIQNTTPFNQEGPTITVKAINQEGHIVAEKKIKTTADLIKPRELVPFYTGIAPAPDSVERIEIDF